VAAIVHRPVADLRDRDTFRRAQMQRARRRISLIRKKVAPLGERGLGGTGKTLECFGVGSGRARQRRNDSGRAPFRKRFPPVGNDRYPGFENRGHALSSPATFGPSMRARILNRLAQRNPIAQSYSS
jgi:hypothetical protein